MSSNLEKLQFHIDANNKNNFIYELHENDIFLENLFKEFICEVYKYKLLDKSLKSELINILLYFLKILIFHFDPNDQSIINFPKNFKEKMPLYVDTVEYIILSISMNKDIDNSFILENIKN
jgi:hypothetical protein